MRSNLFRNPVKIESSAALATLAAFILFAHHVSGLLPRPKHWENSTAFDDGSSVIRIISDALIVFMLTGLLAMFAVCCKLFCCYTPPANDDPHPLRIQIFHSKAAKISRLKIRLNLIFNRNGYIVGNMGQVTNSITFDTHL